MVRSRSSKAGAGAAGTVLAQVWMEKGRKQVGGAVSEDRGTAREAMVQQARWVQGSCRNLVDLIRMSTYCCC